MGEAVAGSPGTAPPSPHKQYRGGLRALRPDPVRVSYTKLVNPPPPLFVMEFASR